MDPPAAPRRPSHGASRHGSTATGSLTSPPPPPPPPTLRRRLSLEEDFHYQAELMTAAPRRPSHPPPYEAEPPRPPRPRKATSSKAAGKTSSKKGKEVAAAVGTGSSSHHGGVTDDEDDDEYEDEKPPPYSSSIDIEGVFEKKMEIENTIKRAEDRQWHTAYVTLHGTALNLYYVKKDWGWGRARDGPTISPDNPPWVRKAKLEKSYSLLHADVGIAADYRKRRYVIRVRAEADQFLLSCVELSTFLKWLECLFSAIDIAAPIDDRDFPRDQSIPRLQRIRWFTGQPPTNTTVTIDPEPAANTSSSSPPRGGSSFSAALFGTRRGSGGAGPPSPESRRGSDSSESSSTTIEDPDRQATTSPLTRTATNATTATGTASLASTAMEGEDTDEAASSLAPQRNNPINRLSVSSYPNEAIDPGTGKWAPEHQWSAAHDLLYAKLCYSVLFFKSPRKSNYIIAKGKQWFVDWATGRMFRVLPPEYGEIDDFFGPWQTLRTENIRI